MNSFSQPTFIFNFLPKLLTTLSTLPSQNNSFKAVIVPYSRDFLAHTSSLFSSRKSNLHTKHLRFKVYLFSPPHYYSTRRNIGKKRRKGPQQVARKMNIFTIVLLLAAGFVSLASADKHVETSSALRGRHLNKGKDTNNKKNEKADGGDKGRNGGGNKADGGNVSRT